MATLVELLKEIRLNSEIKGKGFAGDQMKTMGMNPIRLAETRGTARGRITLSM